MSWKYVQANGNLIYADQLITTGYSGFEESKNRPECERLKGIGPIPRGRYHIGERFESESHGPVCMHLSPLKGTETYGRDGFLIHGDSVRRPGTASHGCVILDRHTRLLIATSHDRELEVV
jgi:hypothetical protein